MAADPLATLFRFRDFELDVAAFQLRRNGSAVRLERRPMELLLLLVSRHGRLVTREEIVKHLWPSNVVIDFDTGLNTLVSKVRHALHDSSETATCIETVPGKGYRFIAPVVEEAAASDPTMAPPPGRADGRAQSAARPSRHQWPLPVVVVVVVVLLLVPALGAILWYLRDQQVSPSTPGSEASTQAAVKSIAVLPFADLSPGQDQQYFSDGLTEELLNLLAQSREFRVIARTSSFSFRGESIDVATIARKLNVTHVLEGSVRKSGDRVRITAQLVDAATSTHLWSQTYDRKLGDIFNVQSDIAASVASALHVALGDVDRAATVPNAQAYERFLRARFFHQRRAPNDLERAREYYEQAIEIDPRFARAWAGLASIQWLRTVGGLVARDEGLESVREAGERALALDPSLAEAHLRMRNYHWAVGNQSAADEHTQRAFALEPNDPLVLSFAASTAAREGRLEQAIDLQRRAVAADPVSVVNLFNLGQYLLFAERFAEAKAQSLEVPTLDSTRLPKTAGFVLILNRQFDEALRLVQGWPEGADQAQCLALIYHGLGRRTDAEAALGKLVKLSATSNPFSIAEVHAYRGESDAAFKWLQAATEHERGKWAGSAGSTTWFMRFSPFLKPLHTDARWDVWVASTR